MRLDGKRAIITGGTAGIGLATVRVFSDLGARVLAVSRTPSDTLPPACSTWSPTSPSEAPPSAIATGAMELLGGVDVLVNNAAQDHTNLILDTSDDEIDDVLAVNLAAPIRVTREVARRMVEQGRAARSSTSRPGSAPSGVETMGTYGAGRAASTPSRGTRRSSWRVRHPGQRGRAGVTETPLVASGWPARTTRMRSGPGSPRISRRDGSARRTRSPGRSRGWRATCRRT